MNNEQSSNNYGMNWEAILEKEKTLDFFFNVTIPAAKKRGEPVPHTLILCKYPRLRKLIALKIADAYDQHAIKNINFMDLQLGDIVSALTSVDNRSIVCVEDGVAINRLKPKAYEVLQQAIIDFCIDVEIGRGPGTHSINITVPPFSFVIFYEDRSKIRTGLSSCFDNVIEVEAFTDSEICVMEIHAVAQDRGISFEKEAVNVVINAAKGNWKMAGKYVRWISDYVVVNGERYAIIPKEYAEKVVALY